MPVPSSLQIAMLLPGRYEELLHLQMKADEEATADQIMGTVVKGIEGSRTNSVRDTPEAELTTAHKLPSGVVEAAMSAGIKTDGSSSTSRKPQPARQAEVKAAKEATRLAGRKQIEDIKDAHPQRPESAVGAAIAAAGGKQSAGPLLRDANAATDVATTPALRVPSQEKAGEEAALEAELLSQLLSDQEDGGEGGGSGDAGKDPDSAAALQRPAEQQAVADSSGGAGGPTFRLSPPTATWSHVEPQSEQRAGC